MSHQSMVLGGDTEWLQAVSEQEYLAALADLRAKPGSLQHFRIARLGFVVADRVVEFYAVGWDFVSSE